MSARNSCNVGARQTGGEATVTDTATAAGGDERGDATVGIEVGAGKDKDIEVVAGPKLSTEAGADTVTDVFTCCRI